MDHDREGTMAIAPDVVEDVVETHIDALVGYARQFFANHSIHDAEEVVQDAICRLCQQPYMPENVTAWLYTVVRNAAINAVRNNKLRKIRETEHQPPLFEFDEENPFDVEKLMLSFEKLDSIQREIVTLHIWGDLPLSSEQFSICLGNHLRKPTSKHSTPSLESSTASMPTGKKAAKPIKPVRI